MSKSDWSSDVCSSDLKVGEVSVNEKLYRPRHIWNDYRPCLDRVSTHYRPTIDRLSTECRPTIDRVSTEYRPTVDRVSTDYRPSVDRVSTAISTDISVDITHSKQDPQNPLAPDYWTLLSLHTVRRRPCTNQLCHCVCCRCWTVIVASQCLVSAWETS